MLVVEDVVTTGLSTRETMDVARALGGEVVGRGLAREPQRRHGRRRACRSSRCSPSTLPTYEPARLPALRRGRARRQAGLAAPVTVRTTSPPPAPVKAWPHVADSEDIVARLRRHRTSSAGSARPRARRSRRARGRASRRLEGRAVTVVGAGRTDAGVHALGQVASATLDTRPIRARWRRALNAVLPEAVRVLEVEDAPRAFHARFGARVEDLPLPGSQRPASSPRSSGVTRGTCRGLSTWRRWRRGRASSRASTTSRRSSRRAATSGRPCASWRRAAGAVGAVAGAARRGPRAPGTRRRGPPARLRGQGQRLPAPHGPRHRRHARGGRHRRREPRACWPRC